MTRSRIPPCDVFLAFPRQYLVRADHNSYRGYFPACSAQETLQGALSSGSFQADRVMLAYVLAVRTRHILSCRGNSARLRLLASTAHPLTSSFNHVIQGWEHDERQHG